jgi:hypothetical protein
MNWHDDWLPVLQGLAAAVIYRVVVHPWLEPLMRWRPRGRDVTIGLTGLRAQFTQGSLSPPSAPTSFTLS